MAVGRSGVAAYAATARRVLVRERARNLPQRLRGGEERLVFVVGSPRSGTTFLAGAIGAVPGFADLTEVTPLKAAIPSLAGPTRLIFGGVPRCASAGKGDVISGNLPKRKR